MKYIFIYGFVLVFLLIWVFGWVSIYFYARAQAQLRSSFEYSCYKKLLVADPINHTYRSTGKIINKCTKAINAVEIFFDNILFDILPTFVQIIVIGIALINFDVVLGLVILLTLIVIVILTTISQFFVAPVLVDNEIRYSDKVSEVTVEAVAQIVLIRSGFATNIFVSKIKKRLKEYSSVLATIWMTYISTQTIPRLMFIISFVYLAFTLRGMYFDGMVDLPLVTGLLITYFSTFLFVVNSGRKIQNLITNYKQIQDVYVLINEYGEQTFPVLDDNQNSN
ncbi:MAG: ABC transporter ATP-binding protein [Thermales bacterium]|nr:ABC transporter ATP-binding protein [Thermales bacterium]